MSIQLWAQLRERDHFRRMAGSFQFQIGSFILVYFFFFVYLVSMTTGKKVQSRSVSRQRLTFKSTFTSVALSHSLPFSSKQVFYITRKILVITLITMLWNCAPFFLQKDFFASIRYEMKSLKTRQPCKVVVVVAQSSKPCSLSTPTKRTTFTSLTLRILPVFFFKKSLQRT